MSTRHQGTDNPLLTYDEAAAWLRVSRRTLTTLVAEGKIPYLQVGRSRRFNPATVLALLEKNVAGAHP